MNIVDRIKNVLAFQSVDRLPLIEWAGYWDKTTNRWHAEGLPSELKDSEDIRAYFGLDSYSQLWITPISSTCCQPENPESGFIKNKDDYFRLKEHLYPAQAIDLDMLSKLSCRNKTKELAIWFWVEGFFWFPRRLLGIERHLLTFYDDPELMHIINEDLLHFNLRVIKEICRYITPGFVLFAEDLSYNHGPMLSKLCFDEFLAPYYKRILPEVRSLGLTPLVDSDGDIAQCIPWFRGVGIEGIGPLERMAGVDVNEIRKKYPDFKFIGGFDKTIMHLGESAMRQEFERLMPVMQQGGYLISVDHQTPAEVSLEDYKLYVSLLKEYCVKAAKK